MLKLPIKYRLYNGFLWVKSEGDVWVKDRPTKAKTLTPITQVFGNEFVWNKDEPAGWKGKLFYKEIIGGMDGHNGIDFVAPTRTCLYAPEDGVITKTSITYGKSIYLKSNEWEHTFGHLHSILVIAGQEVKRGQLIGLCDNTGIYTTAPHLHWGCKPLNFDPNNGYGGYKDQRNLIENLDVYAFPDVYTEIDEYRIATGVEFNKDEEWAKIQKRFNTTITRHNFHDYLTIKSLIN